MLEFMVERLFFLVPALPETLGDLTPNLQVTWIWRQEYRRKHTHTVV